MRREEILEVLRRFQLTALIQRHHPTRMVALFSLINGTLSIGLLAGWPT